MCTGVLSNAAADLEACLKEKLLSLSRCNFGVIERETNGCTWITQLLYIPGRLIATCIEQSTEKIVYYPDHSLRALMPLDPWFKPGLYSNACEFFIDGCDCFTQAS